MKVALVQFQPQALRERQAKMSEIQTIVVPEAVKEAAATVESFFKLNGIDQWGLMGIQSRNVDIDMLFQKRRQLRTALLALYNDTAEYITINKLGDVHHNRAMQMARDALKSA